MATEPIYYETFYLLRPDIKDEELSTIQDKLNKSISSNEGEIVKSDKWAERDLAYTINDYEKGIYYILVYTALPKVVSDIEKHLRFHNNDVLRFITVKTDAPQQSTNDSNVETTKPQEESTAEEGGNE